MVYIYVVLDLEFDRFSWFSHKTQQMASKMAKQLHGSIIKNTDKFIGKVTPEGFFDIFHFCETVGISFMLTFNQNPP